jgi:hypothetical protein
MNILFITHASLDNPPYGDGSTRYRCFNVGEVARTAGHRVRVKTAASVNQNYLHHYDLISWLRPEPSDHLFRLMDVARQRGIICIADLDDLIVNPELAAQSPAVVNRFVNARHVRKRFSEHARAVSEFDAITVSTDLLQQQVKTLFPQLPVATVHNGLSEFWLQHLESAQLQLPQVQSLAYLSGTRSHDHDFSTITSSLLQWLADNTSRQLCIVGKIDVTHERWPAAQLKVEPWKDYFKLPAVIGKHCATLAPLSSTIFNQAKSHVKFIESAAAGVPLIATPIADIAQHRTDGLLLASDETQWQNALTLASNVDYRAEHANSLKTYATECCTATTYASPLIQAWSAGRMLPDTSDLLNSRQAA